MSLRRAPLPSYAPRSAAAQIYLALWKEIAAKLALPPPGMAPEPPGPPDPAVESAVTA
jgi:hypothetical protein